MTMGWIGDDGGLDFELWLAGFRMTVSCFCNYGELDSECWWMGFTLMVGWIQKMGAGFRIMGGWM